VRFTDIAGQEDAKAELKRAVILPRKQPHLVAGEPTRGILLYGPPGTGKTELAKAVATEGDSTFFCVSVDDILDKYVGNSERTIKLLFEAARARKPSVIFFDEVDSLSSKRKAGGGSSSNNGVVSALLTQMNGAAADNEGILVLAATNLPENLDPGIRRRFETQIYVSLPDAEARKDLFRIRLRGTLVNLRDDQYEILSQLTEHFSGSDIGNVVRIALQKPQDVFLKSKYFKKVTGSSADDPSKICNDMWSPCEFNDSGAVAMNFEDVPTGKLARESAVAQFDDLVESVKKVTPNSTLAEIAQYKAFQNRK